MAAGAKISAGCSCRTSTSLPRSSRWRTPAGCACARRDVARAAPAQNRHGDHALDLGEAGNIHPKNKQDVGKRRSVMWALASVRATKVALGDRCRQHRFTMGKWWYLSSTLTAGSWARAAR